MEALIVIFVSGLIALFAAFAKKPALVNSIASCGLILALASFFWQLSEQRSMLELSYQGLVFNAVNIWFCISLTAFGLLIVNAGYSRFRENLNHTGDYIGLILFSLCGAIIMATFSDMFMFFLGLEIMSIPVYVMAGSKKDDVRSTEAALKYFLTGSFATGLMLFGIAWVYGATGAFTLEEIMTKVMEGTGHDGMLYIGILLIMASLIFKVGAAPFHFWSPDVYEGSPYVVTGYMASVVKMAAFFAFLKIFVICFGMNEAVRDFWVPAIAVLSVITMFVGNLSALRQAGVKRMLAYSSITHVGYTLLVLVASSSSAITDLWFYLTAYGFSIIAIMTIGSLINDPEDSIANLRGLAKRNPFLATVFVLAVLSLSGIPPTAGFFGKYMVFASAWREHSWLVIVALINSAISIYYYLRLIWVAVSKEDTDRPCVQVPGVAGIVLVICTAGILLLSLLPLLMHHS